MVFRRKYANLRCIYNSCDQRREIQAQLNVFLTLLSLLIFVQYWKKSKCMYTMYGHSSLLAVMETHLQLTDLGFLLSSEFKHVRVYGKTHFGKERSSITPFSLNDSKQRRRENCWCTNTSLCVKSALHVMAFGTFRCLASCEKV